MLFGGEDEEAAESEKKAGASNEAADEAVVDGDRHKYLDYDYR